MCTIWPIWPIWSTVWSKVTLILYGSVKCTFKLTKLIGGESRKGTNWCKWGQMGPQLGGKDLGLSRTGGPAAGENGEW